MRILFIVISLLLIVPTGYAAPVLMFSDINSGPKTGNGDGLGDGVIVTVWGYGLGSSQGASTISVGGVEASYVYYWENADSATGDSGPSDMYTYHQFQEIAFAVDSTASDGVGTISVTVDSVTSNTLPFTVRSGNIYFIKTAANGGSDSNPGTWSSPWLNIQKATYVGPLVAGDTVYVGDGVEDLTSCIVKTTGAEDGRGTAANPVSMIAYPGADVLCSGNPTGGIGNWQRWGTYWNWSKFRILSDGGSASAFKGMRFVGNEITDITCANGSAGAVGGSAGDDCATGGGIKVLGNYIHDWGCSTTSNQEHVFYLSNRSGSPCESYELGWNHLADNEARNALHLYDEGASGDFTGVMKLHDNAIINQTGAGFAIGNGNLPDPPSIPTVCWSMPVEVYNNLFVNCGIENSGGNYASAVLIISGIRNFSDVTIYNNTIYGGIDPDDPYGYIYSPNTGNHEFMGTLGYKNNIVYDLNSLIWNHATWFQPPDWSTNNLWYNGGDNVPASPPAWDNSPLSSDPKFVNPVSDDFSLQADSPSIDSGTDTNITKDFIGLSRPQNSVYDMGVYEYPAGADESPPTPDPMTWSSEPAEDSPTQISMTSTTGSDASAPIEYSFDYDQGNSQCGSDGGTGGTDSGWQSADVTYSDSGLQPNQCYGYTVQARDAIPNTGTASTVSADYTAANTPGVPIISNPTLTTLDIGNDANANPSANPATTFAVQCTTTSPADASWLNKWIDASGDPQAVEVWLSDAVWDAITIGGLSSGTTYGFKSKSKNGDGTETPLSSEGNNTTEYGLIPDISGAGGNWTQQ